MKRLFAWARNMINNLILWGGFILAVIGGLAATKTFLGTWIVKIVQILPWWAPFPLIIVGAGCVLGDLGKNGIPERLAIYIPMVWPSFFLAIEGDSKLEKKLTGWVTDLSHWLDKTLGEWLGRGGSHAVMTIVAMTCLISAAFFIERYAPKKGTGTGTATGARTATSTGGVAASRVRGR